MSTALATASDSAPALANFRARRRELALGLAVAFALLLLSGCASSRARRPTGETETGVASWYGPGFHGRDTASGERYDQRDFTAAHRTLPFGAVVEVLNLDNGLATRVRINDRGPFRKNRIIDLSNAAAEAIGMIGPGTARVELRVLALAPAPRFVVQVGAFQERALADARAETLAARYPDVRVSADAVWFRVQLGDFASRDAAEAIRRRLVRAGYAALVVPLAPASP